MRQVAKNALIKRTRFSPALNRALVAEGILDLWLSRAREASLRAMNILGEEWGVAGEDVARALKPYLESLPHILVHEVSHALAEKLLEGVEVEELARILCEEVLARFVERMLSRRLREEGMTWLLLESFEEQVRELGMYPGAEGLSVSVDEYRRLYEEFEERAARGELSDYVKALAERVRRWLGRG